MAYTLYTQSFGLENANAKVTITESITGMPATVLATSSGGTISDKGIATLNSSGNLSVYIDTSRTWVVSLVDEVYTPIYTTGLDPTTASQIQTLVSSGGTSALAAAQSGAPLSITLDGSNRVATMTNGTTGRVATFTYTDSTHLTISDNQTPQAIATMVLDNNGRLVSYSGNF